MTSCFERARQRVRRSPITVFALLVLISPSHAIEIRDSFRGDKLPEGWTLDSFKETRGGVTPTSDGLLFAMEPNRHAIIKRELNAQGSDERPLVVSAKLKSGSTSDCSCYLFWDNKNYAYFRLSTESHVYCGWLDNGVDHLNVEHGVTRDAKNSDGKLFGKELHVRMLLVSKNIAFFVSNDGLTWRKIMDANARPGPANTAPKLLILGRGFPGDKDDLGNDLSVEKKVPLKFIISDVSATDNPAPNFDNGPDLVKKDSWDQTLAALEPAGIPRAWTFVAPITEKAFTDVKDWLPIENWSKLKDVESKRAKIVNWNRPDDETDDCEVDLREQVEHVKNSYALCRTEIEWPVSGEALIWFDCADLVRMYVNNVQVFASDSHDWWQAKRAVKDRRAIPVYFTKGRNTVKISIKQSRGEAQFFFRSERSDPAYRVGLLEKMIGLFPPQTGEWRSAAALLDIARLREDAFDFSGALKAYNRAFDVLQGDVESRLRAFEGALRVHAFLRDNDGASRQAQAFLKLFPRSEGAASAMRAALRFETLAGRASKAREQVSAWSAPGQPSSGVIDRADMLRVIAGALADAGDRNGQLSLLDEMTGIKELSDADRARGAIESAVWRWEYERRKRSYGAQLDPLELTKACASFSRALEILPGGKNPAVKARAESAATQLKNKNAERAVGAYWGAALLALAASEPETAYYFALNGNHPISLPLMDKDRKNEIRDQNFFKMEAWRMLSEQCGDPLWLGKWRQVGFKRASGLNQDDISGPEKNADPAAKYGDRSWTEFDPESDKSGRLEMSFDVKRIAGNFQIVYLARDFETASATETKLQLSNSGAWTAWVDGKLVGRELGPDDFRIEDDRIPLKLEKGKHRLLIRLELPQDGSALFRARLGTEPHMAMLLYVTALCAEQFPITPLDRCEDVVWIRENFNKRSTPDAFLGFAEQVAQIFEDHKQFGIDQIIQASHNLREINQDLLSVGALRGALRRLEDGPNFSGRSQKILELSRALARVLVHMGSTASADAVLRDAANRFVTPANDSVLCLAWRGALRRDLGMSAASLPFFERCAREGSLNDETRQIVGPGLEWARFARPERVLFESSRDAQSQLDGVRRQLSGAPDDAEKAMRQLSDILRSTSGSLVKVFENSNSSRYVGVREYVRTLIEEFTPDQRAMYQKVVGEAAAKKLTAISQNDPADLESAALEYPHTRESQAALNRAGNLYLDRGNFSQAASIFQMLLREKTDKPDDDAAGFPIHAKLAVALFKDGQSAEADKARAEFERVSKGANIAADFGARLATMFKSSQKSLAGTTDPFSQFMGSLQRTGALSGPSPVPGGVVWAHPLIASGVLDFARNLYGPDAQAHLQSFPATDGTRVFVGAMESLRAMDLQTGAILWTQTWASGSLGKATNFNGFPLNAPAIGNGKVFVRAQSTASALKCFDAATGAPLWSSDSQQELRNLVWISDPALAYGMLFAVCIEPGDFNLHCVAALDAETGRLRWRTALANGSTGIKLNDSYYQSTFHMGPPAVDAGEIYVETGLASVAALNAFNGQPRWLAGYPRMAMGDSKSGLSRVFEFENRTFKVFSRAPLPPMLSDSKLILAPLDANGVMAFDRRDGTPLWHREMIDARYVAGIVGGKILACDEGLIALNAETGATEWKTEFESGGLVGAPTLSGGTLYLPTRGALKWADALTGRELGSAPWDARTGACANMLVTSSRIVAVTENTVVALGVGGSDTKPLPLYEARRLEAEGKLEEAAQRYGVAQGTDKDNLPLATAARVRVLKLLGKKEEALNEIARFEREAPVKLSAMGGLWVTRRELIVRSLRRLLDENSPDPIPPPANGAAPGGLNGVLAYSDSITGDSPVLSGFEGDPPNRLYVRINGDVQCLNVGASIDVLWSAYVGTNVRKLIGGKNIVAAMGEREITVLDRDSGELVSRITMPRLSDLVGTKTERALILRRQRAGKSELFSQATTGNGMLFTLSDTRLIAWNPLNGKIIWSRAASSYEKVIDNALAVFGSTLVRVHNHREELYVTAYDAATGTELNTLNIEKQSRTAFSNDHLYLAARTSGKLTLVDLKKQVVLWRKDVGDFDLYSSSMEFTVEGQLRYSGVNKNDNNRHTVKHFDVQTGNETEPALLDAPGEKSGGGLFTFADRGYKISRLHLQNGVIEPLWISKFSTHTGVGHSVIRTFASGRFLHCLFLRSFESGSREQLFLRTLDIETGHQISEQILPGSPIIGINPTNNLKVVNSTFILAGDSLVYTAREGVFVYRPQGETNARAVESLRRSIDDPDAPLDRIKHLRRGLAGLEESESMAFVTPADARADGDLSEWKGTEPVPLNGRANYVALSADASLNGPGDLSAKIYTSWNQDGVMVAVDVQDDHAVMPRPGSEGSTGDRVRIVIDSRAGDNSALEPGECFMATLALGAGGPVFLQEFGITLDSGPKPEGKVTPSVTSAGRQYELFVPWTVLRKDARERPGDKREIRLGVAVFDDDGSGTKGALEWGAGAALPTAMPMWLSRVTLIDVSAEKIVRYRKVIEMAPGSPESLKFLRLILLSKRGLNADAESAQELERFLTRHPVNGNTVKTLALLKQSYVRLNDPNPAARLAKFIQSAKIPAEQIKGLECAFKVWVYLDPKAPPKMLMVQFSTNDWNWGVARAYWGANTLQWGKDGSNSMRRMGDIPKAGEWVELRVSPFDLGVENMDIRAFSLAFMGGNAWFDKVRVDHGDSEVVLLDDALPLHWQTQHSAIQFVDAPKHDGEKSFTLTADEPNIDLHNIHFALDNWQNIVVFFDPKKSDAGKDPANLQETYRNAAQIINDTQEGLSFLRKAIDLNPNTDVKVFVAKATDEIRAFMKSNPNSPIGFEALKLAFEYQSWTGADADPMARVEELIRDVKPSLAVTRQFYAERAQGWTEWQVLGPFQAVGERRGMEVVTETERAVNLNLTTQSFGRDLKWLRISSVNPANPKVDASIVDMRANLDAEKESYRGPYFGYAFTKFNCPSKRRALVAFGADDVISVWVNGKRVANEVFSYPQKDKQVVEVPLLSGENEVLIKVGIQKGKLAFVFRVADLDGKPFADIKNE